MTNIISLTDINIEVNHEPRILDIRLAEALGFKRAADIRPLIERHKEALERFGEVFRTARKTTSKGGRPTEENYLNEKQATYICTKSETDNATEIVIHMVEVFYQVRHGQLTLSPATTETITPAQQQALQQAVKAKHEKCGLAYVAIWSRFNNHFQLGKYSQLPASRFDEALSYIEVMPEQKELPAPAPQLALPNPAIDCRAIHTACCDLLEIQNHISKQVEGLSMGKIREEFIDILFTKMRKAVEAIDGKVVFFAGRASA